MLASVWSSQTQMLWLLLEVIFVVTPRKVCALRCDMPRHLLVRVELLIGILPNHIGQGVCVFTD